MFTILNCIMTRHDLSLLALALLTCAVATLTAFRSLDLARAAAGPVRRRWLLLAGLLAGGGIWSTHFISMLAYSPGQTIRFELSMTAISLGIAILGLGLALFLATELKGRLTPLICGVVAGLGIAGMHYLGITAVQSLFGMKWTPAYVAASIALSIVGSWAAFEAAARLKGLALHLTPAAFLTIGILGLHFTAMTGLTLIPALDTVNSSGVLGRGAVALIVGVASALILLGAAAILIIESQARRLGLRSIAASFREVPIGCALFDSAGCLLLWNPAYEAILTRYGAKLAVGQPAIDMVGQVARSGLVSHAVGREAQWADALVSETASNAKVERRFPDGRWVRIERCELQNHSALSLLTDITEEKMTAASLTEARDRAEAANQSKSQFLANMSHEIRTPLNGILGMAQVMQRDELNEAQSRRLVVMRESGEALLSVLNAVLDISKAEAGTLDLTLAPADVAHMVESCCAAFEGAAGDRDIALTCTIDQSATGLWRVDVLRLRQVLSNLIANGLKFTLEGTVEVRLTTDGPALLLEVEDTGIGMDEAQIPRMFDNFIQGDPTATRRFGGTGLGLSICRELVQLMGGAIHATGQPDSGSCFSVRITPERIASTCPAIPADTPTDLGGRPRIHVLAAEDNMTNQLVLRSLLSPLGVDLTMVENGAQAVAAAELGTFDLILMDIQMPVMSGVDATLAIRDRELETEADPVPIIAVSANILPHQIEEYRSAGIDGWVAKPIEVSKLYEAIDRALAPTPKPARKEAA